MLGGHLNSKAVAFAATSLGASLINPIFSFYYVKIYLNQYHVIDPWFQLAQTIFMVWNAVNDPLFGCLQDNARFLPMMRSRRHSILYGAPLFAISFILPWFPWTDYNADPQPPPWIAGIQLLCALCFYDAMFTFVLLAQCALMAELGADQTERVRLVRYSQAASLIGSVSVFVCDTVSSGAADYFRFQMTCVLFGVLAGLCFAYTGLRADTKFDQRVADSDDDLLLTGTPRSSSIPAKDSPVEESSLVVVLKQTKEIFAQKSFVSFVLTNLCQIYHQTFLANFANIIGDRLIGDQAMSPQVKSSVFGALFILPQILVVVGSPLVARVGYYSVIRASFIVKIICGLTFMIVGHESSWIVATFLLVESANVNGTFSLFGLCLSDVIDIDRHQQQRRLPLSSMVFGLNALVTKPAISLAPMITVAVLNMYGYANLRTVVNSVGAISATPLASSLETLSTAATGTASLTTAMFYMTCMVSICTGLIQLLLWSFYTIRDSHNNSFVKSVHLSNA